MDRSHECCAWRHTSTSTLIRSKCLKQPAENVIYLNTFVYLPCIPLCGVCYPAASTVPHLHLKKSLGLRLNNLYVFNYRLLLVGNLGMCARVCARACVCVLHTHVSVGQYVFIYLFISRKTIKYIILCTTNTSVCKYASCEYSPG